MIEAIQENGSWVTGPVEGQLHEIYREGEAEATVHGPAIRFSGQVVPAGIGVIQVSLVVSGDLNGLAHLHAAVQAKTPGAAAPVTLTGTISDQGLHGSLTAVASSGTSQTIQW